MSYKHIVVNMGHPASQNRAGIAARLARTHGAFLLGRHYTFDRRMPDPGATQVSPGQMGGGALAAVETVTPATDPEQSRESRQAQESFDQAVRETGIDADFDSLPGGSRPLWECLLEDACCTDLVIVGKPKGSEGAKSLVKNLAANAGAPVLLVPDSADTIPGSEHVVVAWNGSQEAARAVRDAIPLIESAKRVSIVMVKPKAEVQASARRLQKYLETHGASVETRSDSNGLRVSDSLISRAEELGGDVVVMGAFGRARIREMVTGGATTGRTVESATVPLLLAQ